MKLIREYQRIYLKTLFSILSRQLRLEISLQPQNITRGIPHMTDLLYQKLRLIVAFNLNIYFEWVPISAVDRLMHSKQTMQSRFTLSF